MHNFKNLDAWKEGMGLSKIIYLITKDFPGDEKFGLISQMRRASVSIISNIAEGSAKSSSKEFSHFLSIAQGSAFELESQILLSIELGHISLDSTSELILKINKIQKIIYGLKKSISLS